MNHPDTSTEEDLTEQPQRFSETDTPYPRCSTPPVKAATNFAEVAESTKRVLADASIGEESDLSVSSEHPDDSHESTNSLDDDPDSSSYARGETTASMDSDSATSSAFGKEQQSDDYSEDLSEKLVQAMRHNRLNDTERDNCKPCETSTMKTLRGPDGKRIFVWEEKGLRRVQGMPAWMDPDNLDELSEIEPSSDAL
ncbi:unnamed protein product [Sympodiomycopsis kandeliae]